MNPVLNKIDMYKWLTAGEFGNTIPQYFDVSEWINSGVWRKYEYWGVRSLVPGGPCFLDVPSGEVYERVEQVENAGCGYNISMMIDKITTVRLWAEITLTELGLYVYGITNPNQQPGNWRSRMPTEGISYYGICANRILHQYLNYNSIDDLNMLLESYPDHIVELSACEDCIGTIEHRNAVIWEVRKY